MAQNSQWHDAIYQSAQVNGLPLYTKKPNWYGPGGMQDWLAAQQQEHQSIATTYQMGSTGDLYDVDPKNKESMKLWMAAHAMEHVAILQAGTGIVTAQYNVSYNYAYGWLDTLSINSGTATLDPTPFYRYPSNPDPSWGTYPATLGDGATWPFEDGNTDGWFASGSGVSVQANTNAANAYSGEGSLQVNLSLGSGAATSVAVQLGSLQQLGSNNLYAAILLSANASVRIGLWFQDSSGNRANSAPIGPFSNSGWYIIQYQNGDGGQSVPGGMNWNAIQYVGASFYTLNVPNPLYNFSGGTDGWSAGSGTNIGIYNGQLRAVSTSAGGIVYASAPVPGAPLFMQGVTVSVPYTLSAHSFGTINAIDANGNSVEVGYFSSEGGQLTGTAQFTLEDSGSFNASIVSSFSIGGQNTASGTTAVAVGNFSTNAVNGFDGTVYLDHANIGGPEQTPAPLYGWGVSTPSTIPLRTLESVASSTVNFSSSFPSGTYGGVYARVSTDNGTTWGGWAICTSGQPLPGLPTGINGQQLAFQFNVTLYGSSTNSPSVGTVSVTVNTELTFLAPIN